jgi:colanic acid biosynthesis glycosyl transferase WcaI
MRICIVNEFFYPDSTGGTGEVLSDLARTLKDTYKDLEIEVITSRHLYRDADRKLVAYEEWDGIKIFRVAAPRPSKTSAAKRLAANFLFSSAALLKLLRARHYDLVLLGTAPPTVAITAHTFKRLTGIPYAYIIYDLEPDRAVVMKVVSENSKFVRIVKRFQHRWLHAAGKTIVLGRCMRDHLIQNYGLPADKIAIIPIGADPEIVRPMSKNSQFRTRHGLNGFIALYSGNFGRYHNFDAVLDAARTLQSSRSDITFVLVGSGAQKEHIAQRIADEKLGNVRMFPFVPLEEFADLLASADVSLVTLEPGMEGICVPSKFYSILASGRPTIAMMSPKSEVALVIQEAQCGFQFDPQDSDGLIAALTRLADQPAELERMGQNARRRLLNQYTTSHIARAYYQAFLDATGCKREEDVVTSNTRVEVGSSLESLEEVAQ